MYYKKATATNIPEIKLLWAETFGDTSNYIEHFISHFGIENGCVCETDGKIVAMAFALPTTVETQCIASLQLKYIYACATHPDYQGQGIMAKLLDTIYQKACSENTAGVFLQAADQYLANYYRKLGFEDFFHQDHFWYYKHKLLAEMPVQGNTFNFISPKAYHKKRAKKLENHWFINWDVDFFQFLNEWKIQFCEYQNTIFSFKTMFRNIIVDELLGETPPEQIAHLLFEYLPEFENICIRLIGGNVCCGQMKWCNCLENQPKNGYFAFAME